MACKKITKTNNSDSELIKTLEEIFKNEFKAEEAYAYFDVPENGTSDFIEEFGDYLKGYQEGDPSFHGRVDENGEPKLFFNESANKHYFLDKNKEEIFYPLIKRGLRSLFDYKQMDKIISRLALNYFKKSNLDFNNFKFEDGEKLPRLEEHIKSEIESKIKELNTKGVKGKIMARVLTKSLDFLDEYVEKIDSFYKQISIKRVDNDEEDNLQSISEEGKDPVFNKASFEQDSKQSLSNNIKLRLSLLENKEDLDPVWNEPTFVSFNEVYSTLINNITNQVAIEGEDIFDLQRNEVKKLSFKKKYLSQLVDFFNDKRFTEVDKNQFAQTFNLHKNNFLVSEIKKTFENPDTADAKHVNTHTVKEVSESGSKVAIIFSEWGNNFKNLFLTDNNKLKEGSSKIIDNQISALLALSEIPSDKIDEDTFITMFNSYILISRSIGIELTEQGFTNYLDDNGAKAFNREFQKDRLLTAINRTRFVLNKSNTFYKKETKDFRNQFESQSIFKDLAKAEAFFVPEGSDASIWTSGKNKWLYSYPSYISTRILQWKKNPKLLENWYNASAYNQGSALAKYLLGLDIENIDEFGNKLEDDSALATKRKESSKDRLDKLNLGVFNTFQESNGDSVSASDTSFNDYLNDHINKVLANSYVRTTTPADKTTDYQIRTGFFLDTTTIDGDRVSLNDDTLNVFFNYFNSEFNRMKEAYAEVDAAIENPENLKIHYHFKAGSDAYARNGNAFQSQYFPDLSFNSKSNNPDVIAIKEKLYNEDGSIKHTSSLALNNSLKEDIKDYINSTLTLGLNETVELFLNQDIIRVDNEGEFVNNLLDKNTFNKYIESNLGNHNDAVISAASDFYINGIIQNIEYSKLFTGDMAFYKNMVDYKKRVPGTYTDGLQLRLKKGEESFTVASINSIERESPVIDKLVDMIGEDGAKPYRNINSADAQAWITPTRWKFLLERLGKWSPAHDSVYTKMTSEDHPVYTEKELKIMAQPLKGVYFYMNGKTPTYLKYSQAVLTKGFVKGTGLESVFNQMDKQGVDELITIDGYKVGSPTPTTIHNEDGSVKDNFTFNKVSLSNAGWKLQQDLPVKTFKATDVGSQIQKNIFAGLKFNKKTKGFNLEGDDVTGQQVIDEISSIVRALIYKGIDDVNKEFGVDPSGKIKNIKTLYGALVRELESRGGSKNIIDALNKQTALYGMPQSMDKIISIYSSIMNDRLIKIKTNGGAFIQMSNFGISKDDTKDQGIIWSPALENGDTTFEPTKYIDEETGKTKIKPGGILISGSFIAKKIPNYKDYSALQLFGGKDADGNMVEGIIDKEILENIVGYRIPNQGLSSNDALQIVGILPEENGDTVVAYTGITTKTGSDFDIDKMFIMMANYKLEDGKLKYIKFDKTQPKSRQSKEALQNRLIESYKAVLTNEKVIKDVMKPVDIEFIKDEINMLFKADTSKPMFHFDSVEDIRLRYEFIGGKAGVGQEANALVDINRLGDLSLNEYYIGWGHSQNRNGIKETVFDNEYSQELTDSDLNYYINQLGFKTEKDKQAFKDEISKVKIGDSLTAILNAFVDIAKDPYITRGNWTTSTTNTGNLLLRAGVHPLYVVSFMAQPIIKEYVNFQSGLESITSKNTGDTKSKFRRQMVIDNLRKIDEINPIEGLSSSMLYQKIIKSQKVQFGESQSEKGIALIKKALKKAKVDDVSDETIQSILNTIKSAHDEVFDASKITITDPKYNLKYFREQISGEPDSAFQLAVYDKFIELQELSKAIKENVDFAKLDTNGMGKNINSLYGIFNLRQHILNKENGESKALNGLETKLDNTPLGHYFSALKQMIRVVKANPNLFPQGQEKVQDMFNIISDDIYNMPAVDDSLMTDLEKNYYTYTMANFTPFNMAKEEAMNLLSELPKKISTLKKESKGKYLILDELQVKREGKGSIIVMNNRKKPTSFEEKFTDSWRDLMIDDPKLAEDLIKYSFITSGFRMNSTQFYTYIPHEYLLKEGINYFVPNFSKQDQEDFIDKFYLNNTHKYKYVPLVFADEMVSSSEMTPSGFIKKEPGKSRFYVQTQAGAIYKLDGYDVENRAIYTRVNPLGKKAKGSLIVEYGTSFISKTNPSNEETIKTLKDRVVKERDGFTKRFKLDEVEEDIVVEETTIPLEEIESTSNEEENKIEVGRFVKYKNEAYIVTQINDNGTVQIYNPLLEGVNSKISVSEKNLTTLSDKAKIVNYQGVDYIVTPKNIIISMKTNKRMNWNDNDKSRKDILLLANNDITSFPKVETATIVTKPSNTSGFIPANAQQVNAIEKIRDFIENGDPNDIFVLEGKAGTGKTTIVQEAIADAVSQGKNILIAALSHKAKLVLAQKLNKRFPNRTSSGSIAGILGMKMDEETGEFTEAFGEDVPITRANIIIIDEASMVNEEAFDNMMNMKSKDAKIIFLGDRGQLPPIRKHTSDEISIIFQSENKASLTERVRQGEESPILPFADYYWNNSELEKAEYNPVPQSELKDKLSNNGNLVFASTMNSIFNQVVDTFRRGIDQKNPDVIKIVTYRNATRQNYNQKIRKEIFGEDVPQYVKSDFIMFQNNFKSKEHDFSNSDEFIVESVSEDINDGYRVFRIGVKTDENSDKLKYFYTLDSRDKESFQKQVDDNFEKARKLPRGQMRKMAMKAAWAFVDKFANIDHAYAITSHKSQGSTYENVIVDAKDINSVGKTTTKSKSRSIYTALTRASKTAIVIAEGVDTHENNISKALNVEDHVESKSLWDKHFVALVRVDDTLTFDKFSKLSSEEQKKLIECYG